MQHERQDSEITLLTSHLTTHVFQQATIIITFYLNITLKFMNLQIETVYLII